MRVSEYLKFCISDHRVRECQRLCVSDHSVRLLKVCISNDLSPPQAVPPAAQAGGVNYTLTYNQSCL